MVVGRCGIFTICTPLPLGGGQGGKMMNIAHLVAITADSTSETWYQIGHDPSGHHAVLYRTGIHVILAEISLMCHLRPGRFGEGAYLDLI